MLVCNFFEVTPSDDLTFFFESSEGVIDASTLYFTRASKLHYGTDNVFLGSIEVIKGRIEDGLDDLLFESVRLEVGLIGGYQSDPFEDDIFGFSVKSTKDGVESSVRYALISSGIDYCLQLKFLKGFTEEDISDLTRSIVDGTFKNHQEKGHFGDILKIEFDETQLNSIVGSRVIFHSNF